MSRDTLLVGTLLCAVVAEGENWTGCRADCGNIIEPWQVKCSWDGTRGNSTCSRCEHCEQYDQFKAAILGGANKCASHQENCQCHGKVIYGAYDGWSTWVDVDYSVKCNDHTFGGNPAPHLDKSCYCKGILLERESHEKNPPTYIRSVGIRTFIRAETEWHNHKPGGISDVLQGAKVKMAACKPEDDITQCQWTWEKSETHPNSTLYYIKTADQNMYLHAYGDTLAGEAISMHHCPKELDLLNCQWKLIPSKTHMGAFYIKTPDQETYLYAEHHARNGSGLKLHACVKELDDPNCQFLLLAPPAPQFSNLARGNSALAFGSLWQRQVATTITIAACLLIAVVMTARMLHFENCCRRRRQAPGYTGCEPTLSREWQCQEPQSRGLVIVDELHQLVVADSHVSELVRPVIADDLATMQFLVD